VDLLRAADEPHRGEPVAPAVKRGARGGGQLGMIRQPEVVVGAKVQHPVARGHRDVGVLRGGENTLALVQAGGLDVGEDASKMGGNGGIHFFPEGGLPGRSMARPGPQEPKKFLSLKRTERVPN